jgi:F0F1-type ATP synthase epsilon subunit
MADADHIRAEILTPEGKLYEGDLFQLSVRTVIGEIGVRARHAPMLARLIPNEMRLYESREEFNSKGGTRYAAAEGWLEVFANKVVVLVRASSMSGSRKPSTGWSRPRRARPAIRWRARTRRGPRRSRRSPAVRRRSGTSPTNRCR